MSPLQPFKPSQNALKKAAANLLLARAKRLQQRNKLSEAARLLLKAAGLGCVDAAYELGLVFETGQGVIADPVAARHWFKGAADAGHVASMVRYARLCLLQHRSSGSTGGAYRALFNNADVFDADPVSARTYAMRAAETGNIEGKALAGYLLATGAGGPVDVPSALRLYEAAVAESHPEACLGLGTLLASGQAGKPDYTTARACFRIAAGSGNNTARHFLGQMLMQGLGGDKNEQEALALFQAAARKGHNGAMWQLVRWHLKEDATDRGRQTGISWLRKLAGRGDGAACLELHQRFMAGNCVVQSELEAIKWLERGARCGDVGSQFQLGVAYASGNLVNRDLVIARHWFDAAAEQGHAVARVNLGRMLMGGIGGRRDLQRAETLLTAAMEAGELSALAALGEYHAFYSPQPDFAAARALFLKGAMQNDALCRQQLARLDRLQGVEHENQVA